jgi:hypothetical protein
VLAGCPAVIHSGDELTTWVNDTDKHYHFSYALTCADFPPRYPCVARMTAGRYTCAITYSYPDELLAFVAQEIAVEVAQRREGEAAQALWAAVTATPTEEP